MAKRSGAGALNAKVVFQRRAIATDEYGNSVLGPFVDVLTTAARLAPLFGGTESVSAARLAAMQPYNLTVRSSSASREITPAWRVYDARKGLSAGVPVRVFNVKTIVDPDENRQWVEMLVVEGESS